MSAECKHLKQLDQKSFFFQTIRGFRWNTASESLTTGHWSSRRWRGRTRAATPARPPIGRAPRPPSRELSKSSVSYVQTTWPHNLFYPSTVWPDKILQMSIKVAQKWFHYKNYRFWHLYKNWLRMGEIWENWLFPKALKTCPKSNKSPDLVSRIITTKLFLF